MTEIQFLRTSILKIFWGKMLPESPQGYLEPTSLNFYTHTQLPSPFPLNIYWFDTLCVLQKRKKLSRAGIAGGMGTVPLTPLPLHLSLAWFCFKLRITIFKWSLCCGHMVRYECCPKFFSPPESEFLNQPLPLIIIFDILSVTLTYMPMKGNAYL